jgi:hypothetical protein
MQMSSVCFGFRATVLSSQINIHSSKLASVFKIFNLDSRDAFFIVDFVNLALPHLENLKSV